MRGAIVLIMAVLGVALVLSGVAALWGSALARPRTDGTDATPAATRVERGLYMVGRLPAPEVLIKWGVVLLALAAVAAGAISVSATASAGTN